MPPTRFWSSADLDAAIARTAPDVLALLGDGVPRTEAMIVAALAGRHAKDDVRLTVMRLDVVGRLAMRGSRYTLPAPEAEPVLATRGRNQAAVVQHRRGRSRVGSAQGKNDAPS